VQILDSNKRERIIKIELRTTFDKVILETKRVQFFDSQCIGYTSETKTQTQKSKSCLCTFPSQWLGGLLVERRTSVSQIRGSIPGQVAAV